MNEKNIAKMIDKIKELPEERQRSFCWVIKHIEIVDELVHGEKLSQEEMNEELDRKELFEQGREEGREEGLSEGILKSKQEDILEILAFRGDIPEEIRQLIINQTDLDVLKAWHRRAIAAPSISDFVQSMNQK